MKDIRFTGYLTFEDSLRMQRALQPRRLIPPAVLITVATLAATALALAGMRAGMLPALLLLAFLGVFLAVGLRLMALSARKSQRKVYESACIARHGILKVDGIHIKRGPTRKAIPWGHFDRAVEIGDMLAVVKQGESIGFARYMFNTDSEWRRARALILEQLT